MARPVKLTEENITKVTNEYKGRILHNFHLSPSSMTFYLSRTDELEFIFEPDSLKAVMYGRYENNEKKERRIYTLDGKDPTQILWSGTRGTGYDNIEKVPLDKNEIENAMKEVPLSGLYPTFRSEEWINSRFGSYHQKLITFSFRFDRNSLIGAEYINPYYNTKKFRKDKVFEVSRKGETVYLVAPSRKDVELEIPDEIAKEFSIRPVDNIGGLNVSKITPSKIVLYRPQ